MEPETPIEDVSPNGNLQAFVEQDDRVAHFYLGAGPLAAERLRIVWFEEGDATALDRGAMAVDYLTKQT
jgi:hypothetical protein